MGTSMTAWPRHAHLPAQIPSRLPSLSVIGAERAPAARGESLDNLDPGTGRMLNTLPAGSAADIDRAVRSARAAFDAGVWSRIAPRERGQLLIAFAQPAATMALAMDESLSNALNPSTWFALIGRIGLPYGLLWLLMLVFQISAANAAGWLDAWLPGWMAMVLAQAIFLWGLFGTFHLMGYLIYQYHERLGFEPNRHTHAAELPRHRESELVAAASARVREGDSAGALALLRERGLEPEVVEYL
jgi:hypothetical protein